MIDLPEGCFTMVFESLLVQSWLFIGGIISSIVILKLLEYGERTRGVVARLSKSIESVREGPPWVEPPHTEV